MHPPLWSDSLARRQRALLKSGPLHRLAEHAGRHAVVRDHDDLIALALKAIERLVDAVGIEPGVPRADLVAEMAKLAAAIDTSSGVAPDDSRHHALCELVCNTLLNDHDRRQAFRERYLSSGDAGITHSVTAFRLASEIEAVDGRIVIRAESDGVNLFLRALDIELEDAQAAAEAAMQAQLARGRLDLALASAREAQIRSVQYAEKLQGFLRRTRRDVGRVDWRATVPALLDEARAHIRSRLDVERTIEHALEDQLDRAAGTDAALVLVRIRDMLADCFRRHELLHHDLMRAHELFRGEQARQRFQPVPLTPLCAFEHELLHPVLALACIEALPVVDSFARGASPAQPPVVLDLAQLWSRLLRPPQEPHRSVDVEETVLDALPPPPLRFDESAFQTVDGLLGSLQSPVSLEHLLGNVEDQAHAHLLVLRALQHFAPGDGRVLPVHAARQRSAIAHPLFEGDDLLLAPRSGQRLESDRPAESSTPSPQALEAHAE